MVDGLETARLEGSGENHYRVTGPLTFGTVPALQTMSVANVVDLSGVTHADSAGLALLIEWRREAQANGAQLAYVNVPAQLLALAHACYVAELLGEGFV